MSNVQMGNKNKEPKENKERQHKALYISNDLIYCSI
jgi:hypothetical protein